MSSQQLQTSESFSIPCSKLKRAAAYIRVSTSNRSRHGDEVSFDQNPEVQEVPIRASSPSEDGARIASILIVPAARKRDDLVSML